MHLRRRPVLFSMLLLALLSGPPALAQNVFYGVWEPAKDGHGLWVTSDWTTFTNQWSAWEKVGLRMEDFEVYFEGKTPVYAGSFREIGGGYATHIVTDWRNFTATWARFERDGLRMHDFESYVIDGVRWYAGIFHAGTGGHAAWVSSDWADFTAKWADFEKSGLRMHDFETYVENGVRWWAGIFRAGTGGYGAWFTDDWQSFDQQWQAFEQAGLRLVDFEFFDFNGAWTYGGIFRPATGGRYSWFGVDWENFISFHHERVKEGYRLIDIEIYPSHCGNTCMNQVVMPAPDWYDYGITGSPTHCEGLPGTCGAGSTVYYRAPFYEEDGGRFARLSALLSVEPIFTLPFNDTDMKHNGWLYSPGSWHHAIDYYNGKNFNVRAAAPGTVVHVGWDNWSGNTVVVSHDGPGGDTDRFRTIYMHLLDGAENDCATSWSQTVGTLSGSIKTNFLDYLDVTDCNQNGSGTPDSTRWGTNSDTIQVAAGDAVQRGEVLAKAGSTGPGGCGCTGGGDGPNHHLHIFFAVRDPLNDLWYFFDPYGIYGPTECYPTRDDADGASSATACTRYPSAWLGGRPQLAPPVVPILKKLFRRGDANGNGRFELGDAMGILTCKFLGTDCPGCEDAADLNDDGDITIADAIQALTCMFLRRCPELGEGACLADKDGSDRLGCRSYTACDGPIRLEPPR